MGARAVSAHHADGCSATPELVARLAHEGVFGPAACDTRALTTTRPAEGNRSETRPAGAACPSHAAAAFPQLNRSVAGTGFEPV